jgi:ABC-type glutathione transport system ATPase component
MIVSASSFVFQDSATSPNPRLRVGDCGAAQLNADKVMRGAEYTAWGAELLDMVRLPKDSHARCPHEPSRRAAAAGHCANNQCIPRPPEHPFTPPVV